MEAWREWLRPELIWFFVGDPALGRGPGGFVVCP
jgi:hypothetical protein